MALRTLSRACLLAIVFATVFVWKCDTGSRAADATADGQPTVAIGDSLKSAKAVLTAAKREFGAVILEQISNNPDIDYIVCLIEDPDGGACVRGLVYYSRRTQVVIGLSLLIDPTTKSGKAYRSELAAKSISFDKDGGYQVHFLPSPVKDPNAVPRKSVLPPARGTDSRPRKTQR